VSKNIAKVLDAYLFDKDNVEESMSISLEEWIRKYKPIKNIDESRNYYNADGQLRYGWFDYDSRDDRDYLKSVSENKVWTEIHSSGSFEGIVAGAVAFDRLEYYITEIAWDNNGIEVDYHIECKEEYPDCCQDEEEE